MALDKSEVTLQQARKAVEDAHQREQQHEKDLQTFTADLTKLQETLEKVTRDADKKAINEKIVDLNRKLTNVQVAMLTSSQEE